MHLDQIILMKMIHYKDIIYLEDIFIILILYQVFVQH